MGATTLGVKGVFAALGTTTLCIECYHAVSCFIYCYAECRYDGVACAYKPIEDSTKRVIL